MSFTLAYLHANDFFHRDFKPANNFKLKFQ